MKRALVTGAGGYVGRWAAQALQDRGFEVHGVGRRAANDLPGIAQHAADLLSPSAIEIVKAVRPTHLLLSAWVTKHGEYWSSLENAEWQRATLALADAFLDGGGKRIIFAGTCAEYDWSNRAALSKPLKESDASGSPHTVYGCAKHDTATALAARARNASASFVNGRIFFPVGGAEDKNRFLPTVVVNLLAGERAKLGNPDLVRDMIDVRDCGAAFAALADGGMQGTVNVGSGRGTSLGALAQLAAGKLGRPDLLAFHSFPARSDDPPQLVADTARLYQEAGFSPRYSLDQTVESAIEYWRMQAG